MAIGVVVGFAGGGAAGAAWTVRVVVGVLGTIGVLGAVRGAGVLRVAGVIGVIGVLVGGGLLQCLVQGLLVQAGGVEGVAAAAVRQG